MRRHQSTHGGDDQLIAGQSRHAVKGSQSGEILLAASRCARRWNRSRLGVVRVPPVPQLGVQRILGSELCPQQVAAYRRGAEALEPAALPPQRRHQVLSQRRGEIAQMVPFRRRHRRIVATAPAGQQDEVDFKLGAILQPQQPRLDAGLTVQLDTVTPQRTVVAQLAAASHGIRPGAGRADPRRRDRAARRGARTSLPAGSRAAPRTRPARRSSPGAARLPALRSCARRTVASR